ncbi:MAG: hypothetical protein ABWX90_03740 [Candidatus Saccharimonadales bacterium]
MKESEYVGPAFEALRRGNHRAAIDQLQRAAIDTPADTKDDPEAIQLSKEAFKITRMQTLWLMMIVQRLDGRFEEADESRRIIGFYINDPSIGQLASGEVYDTLLARAKEKNDELTLELLASAKPA